MPDNKIFWLLLPAVVLIIGGITSRVRHGSHHHGKGFGHKHGEATLSIDIYAYTSHISHWNAGFKVAFSMILLLMCVCANNLYVSGSIILFTTFVTVVLGRMGLHEYLDLLRIPVAFLIIGSLMILINFAGAPVGDALLNLDCHWFYIFITPKSLDTTIRLWGKAFGAVSAMYMMSLSTMSGEIFVVLRKLHIPALVIELMNMMYRYIFIMLDTQSRMKNSAESRMGYRDYRTSIKSFGNTAGNLLIVSMKRGGQFYDAMEARCYDGELRFLVDKKPIVWQQVAMAVGIIVYCAVVWVATSLGV